MRSWISFPALIVMALAAVPAHAAELTLTLDSNIGYGGPTNLPPDPNTCLSPNCVLFTGTLTDNDVDPQPDNYPSFLYIGIPYTDAADTITFDSVLSLDNIAPTGVLSGDTLWASDESSNPPNTYSGPIFGVDIPVGTPDGVYEDMVNLDITPYAYNANDEMYEAGSVFTVSEQVTVVIPEPSTAGCLFAGLAALAAWCGVKRKWRSSEASL